MKKWISIIGLMGFVLSPVLVLADCISATGFGTSAVNGTYTDRGVTVAGQASYTNGTYLMFACNTPGNASVINATVVDCSASSQYYSSYSTFIHASWTVDAGTSPGGATASTSCPGEGGTASTTATSTDMTETDKLLGSIAFGQTIIITILFVGLVGYVYNKMTPKKPWQ